MTRATCNDHIFLVGFMGSGKTSVSRKLSAITGLSLIDSDYRIEAIQHRKIPRIFAEEGEEGFRKIETDTLAGLKFEGKSIVSCGGGIVCRPENREILKSLGTVVFLDIPLDEAIARISNPKTRPLLSGARPVEDIYDERIPWYREVADITIQSSGKSVLQVANEVKAALESRGQL